MWVNKTFETLVGSEAWLYPSCTFYGICARMVEGYRLVPFPNLNHANNNNVHHILSSISGLHSRGWAFRRLTALILYIFSRNNQLLWHSVTNSILQIKYFSMYKVRLLEYGVCILYQRATSLQQLVMMSISGRSEDSYYSTYTWTVELHH